VAELWYYTNQGKAMDPVSEAELRKLAASGELQPTDLVWKEGMAKWVRAGSAREIFGEQPESYLADDPDTIPGPRRRSRRDADYEDRPRSRRQADEEDYQPRRKKGLSTGAKVGIVLGILGGVVVLGGGILIIVLSSGGTVGDFNAPFETRNRLTFNDPLDPARRNFGTRCKTYNVKMIGGTTYSIILRSNHFDAYLRLEEANGRRIAENDDGGPGFGLDSHILFRCPVTANYRVIATSLGPGVGEFTLSVQPAAGFQK
jgi:uncharacterized protein DUF4339